MALDRDGEDKVGGVLGGIQGLEDLGGQDAVLRPAVGRLLRVRHVLEGRVVVEAEVGVDGVAVVEGGAVVVDGVGRVAQGREVRGGGLDGHILAPGLIGVLAGAEEAAAHARQHLELRVGRGRAHHGHRQVAGAAALRQAAEVRHGVAGEGQALHLRGVQQRFELDEDEVDVRVPVRLLFRDAGGDAFHQPGAVVHRAADAAVQPGLEEAVGEAVVAVGVGEVGEDAGDLVRPRRRAPAEAQGRPDGGEGEEAAPQPQLPRPRVLRPLEKQERQGPEQQQERRRQQDDGPDGQVIRQRLKARAELEHVRGREGRGALEADEAVDAARGKPDKAQQRAGEGPPPEKERRHQRRKDQQEVERKGPGVRPQEAEQGRQALGQDAVVQKLDVERQTQGQGGGAQGRARAGTAKGNFHHNDLVRGPQVLWGRPLHRRLIIIRRFGFYQPQTGKKSGENFGMIVKFTKNPNEVPVKSCKTAEPLPKLSGAGSDFRRHGAPGDFARFAGTNRKRLRKRAEDAKISSVEPARSDHSNPADQGKAGNFA